MKTLLLMLLLISCGDQLVTTPEEKKSEEKTSIATDTDSKTSSDIETTEEVVSQQETQTETVTTVAENTEQTTQTQTETDIEPVVEADVILTTPQVWVQSNGRQWTLFGKADSTGSICPMGRTLAYDDQMLSEALDEGLWEFIRGFGFNTYPIIIWMKELDPTKMNVYSLSTQSSERMDKVAQAKGLWICQQP